MKAILMVLRHLLAILVLPFMVVVGIPHWLVERYGAGTEWPDGSVLSGIGMIAGAIAFLAGFTFFAWTVFLFATKGKGTLAPWDPPRRLVVTGPYQYVRNPMISGVLMMVTGEALVHGSSTLGWWALGFLALNQVYFMILEEPQLEGRFGESYRTYKSSVPRWSPRASPYRDPGPPDL
jgi:protein-S-isoprenylcysteine O-methyltransferase Ste14